MRWTRHRSVCASERTALSERSCSSSSRFDAIAVLVDIGAGAIEVASGLWLSFGLGLTLAIAAFGRISGGHFNPAVSLGLAAARKLSPQQKWSQYWIAQLVGGFVAVPLSS